MMNLMQYGEAVYHRSQNVMLLYRLESLPKHPLYHLCLQSAAQAKEYPERWKSCIEVQYLSQAYRELSYNC